MTWYNVFIIAVILLRVFATPRDRNALSIVLVASFVSTLLVHFVTHEITGAWKLAVPGAVETLTILALITLGRNRTAYFQAVLLLVAWWDHLQCYADLIWKTNVVYDHYEQILGLVAVGQLLGFHDTALSIARAVQKWCYLWAIGGRSVSAASLRTTVVPHPHVPTDQKTT